uniref:ATP synthase complex subunit 8 n=1 Tax=Scolytinae sp. BMNH 1040146 TaxID=1903785 RepID=A0A343A557_9CUCU|nr:ATP synthase F0 subunit 8 [Scolytinae sp. BMNH 1040146]
MPQMAPLSWTPLFIYFSFLYLFIMVMNYYLFNYYTSMQKISNLITMKINWKW